MGNPDLENLSRYLNGLSPGKIHDEQTIAEIGLLLFACWNELSRSDEEGMSSSKVHRIEQPEWSPPVLTFVIERHGATVMGSSRAALHQWTVNVEQWSAICDQSFGYRQVTKRKPPLKVKPIAECVGSLVVNGQDDPRLKWSRGSSQVRILIGEIIPDDCARQTVRDRRRRFAKALKAILEEHEWQPVEGAAPHTYEKVVEHAANG